jgi:exonuclease VII large subunit
MENTMKKEDLTLVKHIGAARMKVLNDSGIFTIKKLHEIPLEKLARVETIGEHYAKLIKDAVAEVDVPSAEETAAKNAAAKEKKIEPIDERLQKQIKNLKKRLTQANEKLKPLGKKKYLEIYVDFKKRSKKLKRHLNKLDELEANLPEKVRTKIIKKADALIATMKNVGKKPKKKTYKSLSQEIQSLAKTLRDVSS